MFANEESVLQYFYEHGEALNIYQLEQKFDNSDRKKILDILSYLEENNFIKYVDSAIWTMTKKGYRHYKLYYIEGRINYNKRNFIVAIVALGLSIVGILLQLRCNK